MASVLSKAIGAKGATAASHVQKQAYARHSKEYFEQAVNEIYARSGRTAPFKATALRAWWERLQSRVAELGDDDMAYSEWSQWMTELDEFREAANG